MNVPNIPEEEQLKHLDDKEKLVVEGSIVASELVVVVDVASFFDASFLFKIFTLPKSDY